MPHAQQSFWFGGSGASAGVLGIPASRSITTNRVATTTAGITVDNDGNLYESNAAGTAITTLIEDWITPTSAAGAAYEASISGVTGTTPSGPAAGVWSTLATDRTWSITQASAGSSTSSFTLTIRQVSNTSNSVSCSVTLTANNNS